MKDKICPENVETMPQKIIRFDLELARLLWKIKLNRRNIFLSVSDDNYLPWSTALSHWQNKCFRYLSLAGNFRESIINSAIKETGNTENDVLLIGTATDARWLKQRHLITTCVCMCAVWVCGSTRAPGGRSRHRYQSGPARSYGLGAPHRFN